LCVGWWKMSECIVMTVQSINHYRTASLACCAQKTVDIIPTELFTQVAGKGEALRHGGVWVSGCIDPRFLDLGTSWRWVVSFTPRTLYLRRKSLRYPLEKRLGGPQNQSGQRREKKILDPAGSRTTAHS
jgi:hypothetical protein